MAISSVSSAAVQQAVAQQVKTPTPDSDGDNDGSKPGSTDVSKSAPAPSVSTVGALVNTQA